MPRPRAADRAPVIAIGLLTYLRPNMLRAALESLARIDLPPGTRPVLLIVDNDPEGSARAEAERASGRLPFPVRYIVEPERGIAAARNRVLEEALAADADFLAFIDDDERPDPHWLTALYRTLIDEGVDAVTGPVYWALPPEAPDWVRFTDYYERPMDKAARTPRPRPSCQCGNVLLRMHLVRDWGLRFDTRLGLSGGEDSEFFLRAGRMGARYLHVEDARVLETPPASRLTWGWFFNRWVAMSRSTVLIDRLHNGDLAAWKRHFLRALPRFVSGPLYLAQSLVAGDRARLKGLKHLAGGIGTFAGLFGLRHREYAQIHGD